jgi:hypothetical protein
MQLFIAEAQSAPAFTFSMEHRYASPPQKYTRAHCLKESSCVGVAAAG